MNLARWLMVETDWDALEADLKVCPYLRKTNRTSSHIILDIEVPGEILRYPSLRGSLGNNNYDVHEAISKHRAEHGLPFLPAGTTLQWGSYMSGWGRGRDKYCIAVKVPVVEYCKQTNRPCVVKENPEIIPFVAPRPHCWFWQHDWEIIPDFVKSTGWNIFFFSSGIQKGLRRCKKCDKRIVMYREGVAGAGINGGWKTCSAKREEYIDSLPRL